jgi:hypothetical protein
MQMNPQSICRRRVPRTRSDARVSILRDQEIIIEESSWPDGGPSAQCEEVHLDPEQKIVSPRQDSPAQADTELFVVHDVDARECVAVTLILQ